MVDGSVGVIAVLPVLFVAAIFFGIRRRRRLKDNAVLGVGLSPKYAKVMKKREAKLEVEIAKRKEQENLETPDSQVWFSRKVENGRLQHWVLIIDKLKYELRRDENTGGYVHNIAECTIDKEKREAALAKIKIPDVDGYYVCLIGWTTLSSSELREKCQEVMKNFGSYNLIWNNCQDFLQKFSDLVVSKHALDWKWFREHTKTKYQKDQKVPDPPEEIIAAQRASNLIQLHNTQNTVQQGLIQNNINLNNQILQAQILQAQIAMTSGINTAVQNSTNPPVMC